MRSLSVLLTILLFGYIWAGCKSTLTGNEGNFEFSYDTDDDILDFNKSIAVGAKLDLSVNATGGGGAVALSAAESDDTSVLAIDSFSGNVVTLAGVGEGSAEISVTGTTNAGDEESDAVNMRSEIPEVLELRHTCDNSTVANYLVDQRVLITYELEMNDGDPVIGYGYYPVTVTPSTGLIRDSTIRAQQFLHFDTAVTAQLVTITSDIDSTALTANLVEESAIDGATMPIERWDDLRVGDRDWYYALPTVGGNPVCQARTDKTVHSDTPTICDVFEWDDLIGREATDGVDEYGWFELEGLATGTCTVTVTYTEGAGSPATQFSVDVLAP